MAKARRVLIVEDDLGSRTALEGLCRRSGLETAAVGTLSEALVRLHDPPDVVLLDLMLPDGDGVRVLRALRGQGLDTRVAVTTALSHGSKVDAVRRLRPDAFLTKPLDFADLRRWLGVA